MKKNITIIGGGVSGLAAAGLLGKEGFDVTLLEKHDQTGGRARSFSTAGYTYDMGPSWYWMPDIFDNFFEKFGKDTSELYDLQLLEPSFRMFFGKNEIVDVPSDRQEFIAWAGQRENGADKKMHKFLDEARFRYEFATQKLLYSPSERLTEFISWPLMKNLSRMSLFRSLRTQIHKNFRDPQIRLLLEFPVIFLGGTAKDIPALYSLMDHAAFGMGTWYPPGGFAKLPQAMQNIAEEQGVNIQTRQSVKKIDVNGSKKLVETEDQTIETDGIIGSGDYHHIESLLEPKYRNYKPSYWKKKQFAPSCLIFFAGCNKKIEGLLHHNLFFDEDYDSHTNNIFSSPGWPEKPLFYVSCTSKTDSTTAPPGHENLFILIPVAPGLEDEESRKQFYYDLVINRMEKLLAEDLKDQITLHRSYSVEDFAEDYNAYNGNAYGLANTLLQTAIFKPSMRNKQVENFFYCGQLTVPGPGVPPALISGQIAAEQLAKNLKR